MVLYSLNRQKDYTIDLACINKRERHWNK